MHGSKSNPVGLNLPDNTSEANHDHNKYYSRDANSGI